MPTSPRALPAGCARLPTSTSCCPSCGATGSARTRTACCTWPGSTSTEIAEQVGTPAYVVDEADLRARARAFATAFAGWDVYYAAKSFLCTAVARWVAEEGLGIDVCTGGELAVVLRAGVDLAPGRPARQQQERGGAAAGADRRGRPDDRRLVRRDRPARALAAELGVRPRVMVRVTTGVEAHTHEYIATAHEDQKFGFSIAGGGPPGACRLPRAPALDLIGIHSHIGSQIFDAEGFEVAARRTLRLHAEFATPTGIALPELDLGGGFGIAYTSVDARHGEELAGALHEIIDASAQASASPYRICRSSRAGRSADPARSPCTGWAR